MIPITLITIEAEPVGSGWSSTFPSLHSADQFITQLPAPEPLFVRVDWDDGAWLEIELPSKTTIRDFLAGMANHYREDNPAIQDQLGDPVVKRRIAQMKLLSEHEGIKL